MPSNIYTSVLVATPSANFTRPPDITAYVSGDLVANSTTAASVVPLSWTATAQASNTYAPAAGFFVAGVKLAKTGTATANAQFRVHLYSATPTVATTGDNGVYASVVAGNANWLASFDGTMAAAHTDGCAVICLPSIALVLPVTGITTVYGLIEARAAYTPANAEVFTATLLLEQNGF